MTPSTKALKAIRLAFKEQGPGIDALQGVQGMAVFVNFDKPGSAIVEIKPSMSQKIDLTEALT